MRYRFNLGRTSTSLSFACRFTLVGVNYDTTSLEGGFYISNSTQNLRPSWLSGSKALVYNPDLRLFLYDLDANDADPPIEITSPGPVDAAVRFPVVLLLLLIPLGQPEVIHDAILLDATKTLIILRSSRIESYTLPAHPLDGALNAVSVHTWQWPIDDISVSTLATSHGKEHSKRLPEINILIRFGSLFPWVSSFYDTGERI